ncbi:WxcM-like domain-containing protein [Gammaproteobacteria bacterium]|nr:WxcM-like domain-containing protein [Gammaproteobacteria bacterium]
MSTHHPTAIIGTKDIAEGVSIGPYAIIEDAVIGPGCNIGAGAWIGEGAKLAPSVQVGAGAEVLPGIIVGSHVQVEPGAVVSRNVPPSVIIGGNPGQISGYVAARSTKAFQQLDAGGDRGSGVVKSSVSGVTLHRLPLIEDLRGTLTVGHFEREVPFNPKRYFVVFDVPPHDLRGEHAHKECSQFMICMKGAISVAVDDGANREETRLDSPHLGLYMSPMIWGSQFKQTPDAVLLVFASHDYDPDDYIRDYEEFLAYTASKRA